MTDYLQRSIFCELLSWFESECFPNDQSIKEACGVSLGTARNSRLENQDRAVYVEFSSANSGINFSLLAVLDGIGGMQEGGKCAEIAISSIISHLVALPRNQNRFVLIEAIAQASSEVYNRYKGRGGTTFAGIYSENGRVKCANVGDSRIYAVNKSLQLIRLFTDDRLGNRLAKLKGLEGIALSPEIANRLGQYLGMEERPHPNVFSAEKLIDPNSIFLVATDGLVEDDDNHLINSININHSPSDIIRSLLKISASQPSPDNISIICNKGGNFHQKKSIQPYLNHLKVTSPHGVFNYLWKVDGSSEQKKYKKDLFENGITSKSSRKEKSRLTPRRLTEQKKSDTNLSAKKNNNRTHEETHIKVEQLNLVPPHESAE